MLNLLLILIFIRPFISSLAFPYLNSIYTYSLLIFLLFWTIFKGLPIKEIKPIRYPFVVFVFSLLISAFFSQSRISSLRELLSYAAGLMVFLACASLSWKDKFTIIRTIILAGVIIGLLALYQYFFGFSHILDYISKMKINDHFALDYIERQRVFFPFITPNTLAGYLILVIPLALINEGKRKYLILAPLLSALFLTQSLGAFLSLFLGMGLYFYLRKDFSGREFTLLLILAVVSISVFSLRQAATKEHILPAFSFFKRLAYWRDTLKIIKTHPFIGIGLGNFRLPLARYAHNIYLQIWAEIGILGVFSFLWLIAAILKSTLKKVGHSIHKKEITSLDIACLVFLIHNSLDFTFFLPELSLIWLTLLGLVFTFSASPKMRKQEKSILFSPKKHLCC